MEYVKLGNTDLRVSRMCLGTLFRARADRTVFLSAIDEAAALGCNFLDCANIYRDGDSERLVGKAIRGRRDQFVVGTKVGSPMNDDPSTGRLSRHVIMRQAEASLERLGTDYIDLYTCHRPDPDTPIEETLGAMADLVRAGKIRYAGASNFEACRMDEMLRVSRRDGLCPLISNQVCYSLLYRRIEEEVLPFCRAEGIGATVFSTTTLGLLSGRFRHGRPPPKDTSWYRGPYNYRAAMSPEVDRVIQELIDIAERRGKTPAQVAMAWCLAREGVSCVITGADTPERVRENCGAVGWGLSEEEESRLGKVSQDIHVRLAWDCPEGYEGSG